MALAISCLAGAASAQGSTTVSGPDVVAVGPAREVPSGAKKQAEDAIRRDLANPDGAMFRAVRANQVASMRHDAFSAEIDGPITLVCGQFTSGDAKGGDSDYAWFLAAIKRGHVLWTTLDDASGGPAAAHDTCKAAGLAK
jgi:hypothetical protein